MPISIPPPSRPRRRSRAGRSPTPTSRSSTRASPSTSRRCSAAPGAPRAGLRRDGRGLVSRRGVRCRAPRRPGASTGAVRRARRRTRPARPSRRPTPCDVIPEETAGPYPGDGSNGPDVLAESGVVRSDIRSSFGTSIDRGGGRPADDPARDPGPRQRLRAARRRRGVPLALRPRGPLLACTRRASRTRTTCAASRRPATTAS